MNVHNLTEGGKYGKGGNRRDNRHAWKKNPEDQPSREKMRPKMMDWDSGSEASTKPLRRFLMANVNRPWDKVYSDLCNRFDARSDAGHDARERIWWYVEKPGTTVEENGKVYNITRGWLINGLRGAFYIDAKGFLRYAAPDRREKRKPEVPGNYTKIGDRHFAQFANSRGQLFWFELIMKPIPERHVILDASSPTGKRTVNGHVTDVLLGTLRNEPAPRWYSYERYVNYATSLYKEKVYAASKRQLSHEEMRRYHFTNEVAA